MEQETDNTTQNDRLALPDGRYIEQILILGEIEGHDCQQKNSKTTKYEELLPRLAKVEHTPQVAGVLVLLNTVGGDVEAGLAIAEMLVSLSKPVVSLVLGGSHSIGVPLAVASNRSFMARSATMTIHPVRTAGTILGVTQSFLYLDGIQNRILDFTSRNSRITKDRLRDLMLNTEVFTRDMGTLLDGPAAVSEGIIDALGGISDALGHLYRLIDFDPAPEHASTPSGGVCTLPDDSGHQETNRDIDDGHQGGTNERNV